MTFLYSVNGVPLTDPAGRWWVTAEGSAHSAAVTMRSRSATVPGMNGIPDAGRETREPSTLPLRVMTRSTIPANREAYWEAIKALFTLTDTFTLGRQVETVARTSVAKLRSISEPDFSPSAGILVGVVTVVVLDGLFHGPVLDFPTTPFNANFTAIALAGLGGTAAIEDAQIRVLGPAAAVSFTDAASGTGVAWAGPLAVGQYLFLNGVEARRSSNAADWLSGGVDVSGGVTTPPAGLLALTPKVNPADILSRSVSWSATRAGTTAATQLLLKASSAHA